MYREKKKHTHTHTLSSFLFHFVKNLDQGPLPGQRIEATQVGRGGRGETQNFGSVKLGQQLLPRARMIQEL